MATSVAWPLGYCFDGAHASPRPVVPWAQASTGSSAGGRRRGVGAGHHDHAGHGHGRAEGGLREVEHLVSLRAAGTGERAAPDDVARLAGGQWIRRRVERVAVGRGQRRRRAGGGGAAVRCRCGGGGGGRVVVDGVVAEVVAVVAGATPSWSTTSRPRSNTPPGGSPGATPRADHDGGATASVERRQRRRPSLVGSRRHHGDAAPEHLLEQRPAFAGGVELEPEVAFVARGRPRLRSRPPAPSTRTATAVTRPSWPRSSPIATRRMAARARTRSCSPGARRAKSGWLALGADLRW